MKLRVALIVSHPIQHFCPQYVSFAQNPDIEFKVFFASMLGYKKYMDPHFKQEISWSNLELDKFAHEFLNGDEVIPSGKNLDAVTLNATLDNFEPDVIITYGYYQKLQRRAHKWAKHNKIPIAYISDSERRQIRSTVKELVKYPFLYWYFSKMSFFFTVGNANESFYRHYGVPAGKFIRMHFPIDIKSYTGSFEQKQVLRKKVRLAYEIREADFVMSVAGKLVSWKNQDHLIDVMLLLEEEGVFLHLFVLGSGPRLEVLKDKAMALKKSRVYFPGFVSIDELPSFYAASDVYVHPASVEPHSIAVSEAIFMGCPVIISDRCGSYGESDDVQEGKNGWVYPFGDIKELAGKIKWMIANPSERKEFGENAHQLANTFQERSHKQVISDLLKKMV
jgi:glycosyltransferase involved in cell wall biosynthesis